MVSLRQLATLAFMPSILAASLDARGKKDFDCDALTLREVGARNTLDWRLWLEKDGNPISFWHDIPLYPFKGNKTIVNMYVEIPRWQDGKLETKRDEPMNPVFHDDKHDAPRYVASVWPHKSYPFLYGSLPQTWEDSTIEFEFTGYPGDNDPMDVFDISGIEPGYVGQVKQVKVLGGLAMIDDETTDWKVIVIDIEDPLAAMIDTVSDLDKYRPGMRQEFYDWFTYYKVVKGSGLNTIVGDDYQNASAMQSHIDQSHGYWKKLVKGRTWVEDISVWQTSESKWCSSYVKSSKATDKFDISEKSDVLPPAERPSIYDHWYYLDEDFEIIPGQVIGVV